MTELALRRAIERMNGYSRPWAIAGGWAIDLFVGRVTRAHADVDIATMRVDQTELRRHLGDATVMCVRDRALVPWLDGEALVLPVHEVHATWPDATSLEFLLNESDETRTDAHWIFRRDPRVRLSLASAIHVRDGFPSLAPEIVLLYKSNDPSGKNAGDLHAAAPLMNATQRRWLHDAIAVRELSHPWLSALRLA